MYNRYASKANTSYDFIKTLLNLTCNFVFDFINHGGCYIHLSIFQVTKANIFNIQLYYWILDWLNLSNSWFLRSSLKSRNFDRRWPVIFPVRKSLFTKKMTPLLDKWMHFTHEDFTSHHVCRDHFTQERSRSPVFIEGPLNSSL